MMTVRMHSFQPDDKHPIRQGQSILIDVPRFQHKSERTGHAGLASATHESIQEWSPGKLAACLFLS